MVSGGNKENNSSGNYTCQQAIMENVKKKSERQRRGREK
jgi:hypothetical protein